MIDKERLLACLKAFNIEPSMATFQDRKRMQKLAYILQEVFKIDLGCGFSWYLHGPYAPNLTRMLFSMIESGETVRIQPLKGPDADIVDDAIAFLGKYSKSTEMLELLGSLDYLRKQGKARGASDLEIIGVLKEKKPFFKDRDIALAWQKLDSVTKNH